jgi:hypothetical protein
MGSKAMLQVLHLDTDHWSRYSDLHNSLWQCPIAGCAVVMIHFCLALAAGVIRSYLLTVVIEPNAYLRSVDFEPVFVAEK